MAFQGRRAVCLSDSGLARNFASSKSFSFGPALAGCVPTDRIRITSSASWHSCPRGGGTEVTLHHANPPDDEMGRGHKEGWTWYLNVLAERFEKMVAQ